MNELLQFAVECKRILTSDSSDEQTKQYYKQMLIDTKQYLDGLAVLRSDDVVIIPTKDEQVKTEIKEPTPPVVAQEPKKVIPKKPPVVDRVKKSHIRKPPAVKRTTKSKQNVTPTNKTTKPKQPKRPVTPKKPVKAPPKDPSPKEEFF